MVVIIIVVSIISCKKKRARVWAVQAVQQPIMQPSMIYSPAQQWSQGVYYQTPVGGPIQNNPPPYSVTNVSAYPPKV